MLENIPFCFLIFFNVVVHASSGPNSISTIDTLNNTNNVGSGD